MLNINVEIYSTFYFLVIDEGVFRTIFIGTLKKFTFEMFNRVLNTPLIDVVISLTNVLTSVTKIRIRVAFLPLVKDWFYFRSTGFYAAKQNNKK